MDLDLAIIGGGPAGVATALFLVHAAPGLRDRIAIVERDRYPRDKICAGAIGGRADRLLASIGVRVDVPSVPVRGLSIVAGAGALSLRVPRAPAVPRSGERETAIGRVVRRIEFDRAFADEARSRGVRIVEDARVTALRFEPDGVRIQSTAGELLARAVVGADGVGSFVRRAIGAPKGRFLAQVAEVDTTAVPSDRARDLLHFDVTDTSLRGYAWDFPTLVGGEPLVCRGVYALHADTERGVPLSGDAGARLLARLERLGLPAPGGSGARGVKRFAERGLSLTEPLAVPRALLVGEAAGIDPVLGEGIAQAIFYGATAGAYLARAFTQRPFDLSFRDWPRAVARSRVGLDLRARSAAVPLFYDAMRPAMERWVVESESLALAGMRYFAGERVPRAKLAFAMVDLVGAVLATREIRRGEATSSPRSASSS